MKLENLINMLPLTKIEYCISDRDKKCRLCNGSINKNIQCIVMRNIHVPPKVVDLFFHEGCLSRGLEFIKQR